MANKSTSLHKSQLASHDDLSFRCPAQYFSCLTSHLELQTRPSWSPDMSLPPAKRSRPTADDMITATSSAGPSIPAVDNPYLAHRLPQASASTSNPYATGANGVGSSNNGYASGGERVKNPLTGLVPRQVTVEQAKGIMVSKQPGIRRSSS